MKLLEKFFYHACAYTVAISVLFFIFAAFTDLESISISIGRYFLIVAFGFFISGAEFIFSTKLHTIIKYSIHFISLFIAFFFIFVGIGTASNGFSAPFVFSAVIIFTLIYFIIFLCVFLAKRVAKRVSSTEAKKTEAAKESYQPRFK